MQCLRDHLNVAQEKQVKSRHHTTEPDCEAGDVFAVPQSPSSDAVGCTQTVWGEHVALELTRWEAVCRPGQAKLSQAELSHSKREKSPPGDTFVPTLASI